MRTRNILAPRHLAFEDQSPLDARRRERECGRIAHPDACLESL